MLSIRRIHNMNASKTAASVTPQILLLSNTNDSSSGLAFGYCQQALCSFLKGLHLQDVTFIPYAKPDYDTYTDTMRKAFRSLGIASELKGIHEIQSSTPKKVVESASALFVGGGNTFRLLKGLQDNCLMDVITKRVLRDGIPYIGSSAGAVVATPSINLTNDMAIVWPSSLSALNLIPCYINAHYPGFSAGASITESRDARIREFMTEAGVKQVLGLREDSYIYIKGKSGSLCGNNDMRILKTDTSTDIHPESDITVLLS